MKVHHIGYLVEDMLESIKVFQEIGYTIEQEVVYDPIRRIDICFMRNGETVIELVVPGTECLLFKTLKKKIGNAPYHICYECKDVSHTGEALEQKGWIMIQQPETAIAIANRMVSFYFHPNIGMIELLGEDKQVGNKSTS